MTFRHAACCLEMVRVRIDLADVHTSPDVPRSLRVMVFVRSKAQQGAWILATAEEPAAPEHISPQAHNYQLVRIQALF